MNKQILFASVTITLAILLLATTILQTTYAYSVYVGFLSRHLVGDLLLVEITGPFGYSDRRTVSTGANATVNFTIPDSEIPYGYQYILKVC